MLLAQKAQSILKFTLSEVRSARDDHPSWLSGSMRINDMKALER